MAREYFAGMGQAVADRTINRKGESWGDVAHRVALGNVSIGHQYEDERSLRRHLENATILMSGRHLQHGDETQPDRNLEIFSNCLQSDTKVLTLEHGPKRIADLVGQTVSVKARDGEWRKATVHNYGHQALYTYKFGPSFGPISTTHPCEVVATANHRWFLADGSVTEQLQVGDLLEAAPFSEDYDQEATRHGLIFGDGTSHKRRNDYHDGMACQGRDYIGIRLCGKDKDLLPLFEGYGVTYPPHAGGDPVVYVGRKRFWKELPFCTDPAYIGGFIHGWWLADGSKQYGGSNSDNRIEISTARVDAVEWLKTYAAYAGWVVSGLSVREREERDGSFDNGKSLYSVRLARGVSRRVKEVEYYGEEEVFCIEEPVTTGFVLANGLLTGNCSTSVQRSITFYLLLNGSGVGSSYDDEICLVDFRQMPQVVCTIREDHPDVLSGRISGYHTTASVLVETFQPATIYPVHDSREGWAQAVEQIEVMAWKGLRDHLLILDFSGVRPNGAPIAGMQGRPASGPGPLMSALTKVATVRDKPYAPWRQAMEIDHHLAECVLVGGARRAARIAVKYWKDPDILAFIRVKQDGGLWSANNSVGVDAEFWSTPNDVLPAILEAQYEHGTGEPGLLNLDMLVRGEARPKASDALQLSGKYRLSAEGMQLRQQLAEVACDMRYFVIVNPCGEIRLNLTGAYCVIADVVPYFSESDEDAEDAFRQATRALLRTNRLPALFQGELDRTNRIGVGFTGIHEYAWDRFGLTFLDLIEEGQGIMVDANGHQLVEPSMKAWAFWLQLQRFALAVEEAAEDWCLENNQAMPATLRTIKPAGTTSKLFGLTEGVHLPPMREYLRWVQFRSDDKLVDVYRAQGYPVRELKTYSGTTVVGFPTQPLICTLGMDIITAAEATPEQQFRWLRLLETFWLGRHGGNQISYTLKYDPAKVDRASYEKVMRENMPLVRAVSVMPQMDMTVYEYQPEEPITTIEFSRLMDQVQAMKEEVDRVHVDCANGACPIDFR